MTNYLWSILSLVSSIFFKYRRWYLYYVYDDRGADLIAASKETLRQIYQNFSQWILNYNREQIDKLFEE